MMTTPWLLNTAWMYRCRGEAKAFHQAALDVRAEQERLLLEIVSRNRDTGYGQAHSFGRIRSVADYQRQVPINSYESLRPLLDRMASGELNVLTAEPLLLLEPTGGSSGAEKLIPYTASLRSQFQRALAAWIWDVMSHMPAVRSGRAYWSISPGTARPRTTSGDIPIGFEQDVDYLDPMQRRAASRLLAVPPGVARLQHAQNFRHATLAYLLAAADLSLISVWSPTFLTNLLEHLPRCLEPICADLRTGCLRLPRPSEEPWMPALPWKRDTRRADLLERISRESRSLPELLEGCFPNLALLSCWADASAGLFVPALQALLPRPVLQPKGLLATEGIVTFPLVGHSAGVLAIRSHFFEFVELKPFLNEPLAHLQVRLADELEPGNRYRVLLTTSGGLYRYDLGDEVELTGSYHASPLLRFLGRGNASCDLVGEKLSDAFVGEIVRSSFQEVGISPGFALLLPVIATPPRYRLLIAGSETPLDAPRQTLLSQSVEKGLRANPQYRYAAAIGQLAPVEISLLQLSPSRAWEIYERHCLARGQKSGDIKPRSLDPSTELYRAFLCTAS